jgi:hypothetical protein
MARALTAPERDRYRTHGRVALQRFLPADLLRPALAAATAIERRAPWQDMLSGIHNPFGHHAGADDAWSFLDIVEAPALLDLVEELIGPDIVLWDSELHFDPVALAPDEARCWPVEPLAGTVAVISLERGDVVAVDIDRLAEARGALAFEPGAVRYAARFMPATSHFNRDPRHAANRHAAAVRPLVNHAQRPIWLVRGQDRGGNDFAAGFSRPVARWAEIGGARDGAEHGAPIGRSQGG